MKTNKLIIGVLSLMFIALIGCNDDIYVGLPAQDKIAPGIPTVVKTVNKHGEAVIYFKAPLDKDLLSVTATYEINGVTRTTSASAYTDSLVVSGFGSEGEYKVYLTSVDKSKNVSESVELTVSSLEPPVEMIRNSINILDAFGGIRLTWENETETSVILVVNTKDSLGDWIPLETFYTETKEGIGTVRDLDSVAQEFQVYVRDRWDNYSEKIEVTRVPMFEEQLVKSEFEEVKFHNDITPLGGYPLKNIWDGRLTGSSGFHVAPPQTTLPAYLTFDMGQLAKLSRFTVYQRGWGNADYYKGLNIRYYEVWGAVELTDEMRESGSLEGWTLLLDAESYRPSGRAPLEPSTNEDIDYAKAGDNQEIPLDKDPVRYIRLNLKLNWSNGIGFTIGEMTFFGRIIK